MNISFIPVRCGSKSIKLKNIKLFCGKPLVYWNIKALSDSSQIDEIIVATDCSEIKKVVLSFNFKKVKIYDREIKNSDDKSSTESVVLEFLNKKAYNKNDNFLLVQATSPLTETKDFENALQQMKLQKSDSILTCVRQKCFVWNDKSKPINYDYMKRPRRQDFKGILIENGSFYISKVSNILSSGNRISGKISIYEMDHFKYIEIDEEDDWIIAERLMHKYFLNKKNKKFKVKLFVSDVDGVLTDSGMYYTEHGDEIKKFNTHDGMAFKLLRENNIKTAIVTSENTKIVFNRANKLNIDYLYQGKKNIGKLQSVKEICEKENISLSEVSYVGDDINCYELLTEVGLAACPINAINKIKSIPNIIQLTKKGGDGAVREFCDIILNNK